RVVGALAGVLLAARGEGETEAQDDEGRGLHGVLLRGDRRGNAACGRSIAGRTRRNRVSSDPAANLAMEPGTFVRRTRTIASIRARRRARRGRRESAGATALAAAPAHVWRERD